MQHGVANKGQERPFKPRRALVIQSLTAQLPNELSLRKGAEVVVTGQTEDGWYEGRCDGRSGIFPPAFVSLLDGEVEEQPTSPFSLLTEVNNQLNISNSNRPYGIANYDFHAQHHDELDLREGQTVYLLKHVNAEWIQGEDGYGHIGIFPTAFVQIVVDCRSEVDDLLMDFDPLSNTHATKNLISVETTHVPEPPNAADTRNRWSSSMQESTNLDDIIAKNLVQLGSSSSSQACRKQRPLSWTQTLAQMQAECSITTAAQPQQLPPVPPRQRDVPSTSWTKPNPKYDSSPHMAVALPASVEDKALSLNEATNETKRSTEQRHEVVQGTCTRALVLNQRDERSPVVSNEPVNISQRVLHPSVSVDCGASSRRSYTRPAPPPPVDAPNRGVTSNRPSQSRLQKPSRPNPISRSQSLEPTHSGIILLLS